MGQGWVGDVNWSVDVDSSGGDGFLQKGWGVPVYSCCYFS